MFVVKSKEKDSRDIIRICLELRRLDQIRDRIDRDEANHQIDILKWFQSFRVKSKLCMNIVMNFSSRKQNQALQQETVTN